MNEFKQFVRTNIAEMIPWTEDMDLEKVSISEVDLADLSPKEGDMIARNPANHDDKWLVSKDYFEANFGELGKLEIDEESTGKPSLHIQEVEDMDMANQEKLIEIGCVFPSEENTIWAANDEDYGGAHEYYFINSLGHIDGKPVYTDESVQRINFVKKEESGMVAGLQSEQLLIALLDRHRKLNAKFPDANGEMALNFMEKALSSLEARVRSRVERGVMGKLQK